MKEYNDFSEWFLRTFSGAYEMKHTHTHTLPLFGDPVVPR